MKQSLLSILFLLVPMLASADAVEINGIYYNLISNDNIAEVTKNPNEYSGEVVIPETVEYEGVTYSVTSIGNIAFWGCTQLESITIPNSVTSIGTRAFSNCRNLITVKLSNSLIELGEAVFEECNKLKSIELPEGLEVLSAQTFWNCKSLISVTLPKSLKTIGYSAFYYCSNLPSISIPTSVTEIGSYVFGMCKTLTSIELPETITMIPANTFTGCEVLESIVFKGPITTIGNGAFNLCLSLKTIDIPNTVSYIGEEAFYDCKKLTSIILPENITEIGDRTFSRCINLSSIIIPSNVKSIGNRAFFNCLALKSINIPKYVETIDHFAFSACKNLELVNSEIETPFSIPDDVFEDISINAILTVPQEKKENYQNLSGWSNHFSEIKEKNANNIKCATPTIAYENGEITFSCETEGVEYVSEIKADDAKKYYDGKITLTNIYTVSVYATKEGYVNSDVATMEIHPTNTGEGGSGSGETGDVNGDKKVDVSDIVKIVNIIMNGSGTPSDNPSTKPSDESVTSMISASFGGGAYSSMNGVIQSGSQLMWRFSNNSTENVTLTGIQLINGATGAEGSNMLTENVEVLAGETKGYTITVGVLGIQQPKVRFTYQYNNKTYTVEAVMPD